MKNKRNLLKKLFLSFFKIGAFTFGGGYAMIAIIENECVTEKKWLTHEEMMDITVIAESTPGPVAINTATFVGYKIAGAWGSFVATLGTVLPSFAIILLISSFLDHFLDITWVASAFQGIKVAVAFLIFSAGWKMFKKCKKSALNLSILLGALVIMLLVNLGAFSFSVIYLILIAAFIGLFLFVLQHIRSRKENEK